MDSNPVSRSLAVIKQCKEVMHWIENPELAFRTVSPTRTQELKHRQIAKVSLLDMEKYVCLSEIVGEPQYFSGLGDCSVIDGDGKVLRTVRFSDTIMDGRPDLYMSAYRGKSYAPAAFKKLVQAGGVFRGARYLFFRGGSAVQAEIWEIDKKKREVQRIRVEMTLDA